MFHIETPKVIIDEKQVYATKPNLKSTKFQVNYKNC